jgi:hypothetical protein
VTAPPPFLVYALPRSRTKWISKLLTWRDTTCHHEAALGMRTWSDVTAFFARPNTGAADTAAAPGWRLLHHHIPALRAVVVHRSVDEIVPAIIAAAAGYATYDEDRLRRVMTYGRRMLAQIAAQPGTLTVDFADLDREDCCAAIWRHCLPYGFDRDHWRGLAGRNVQVRYVSLLQYYHAHRPAIEGFKRACRAEMRPLVRARMAA